MLPPATECFERDNILLGYLSKKKKEKSFHCHLFTNLDVYEFVLVMCICLNPTFCIIRSVRVELGLIHS